MAFPTKSTLFDGVNQTILTNKDDSFSSSSSISFFVWGKFTSVASAQSFIGKLNIVPSLAWRFGLESGGKIQILVSSDGTATTDRKSSASISSGVWGSFGGVYNASAQELHTYITGLLDDGVLTGVVPASINENTQSVVLAGSNTSNDLLDGNALGLAIWVGTALTSAQILLAHDNGLTLGYENVPGLPTPTHVWPLNQDQVFAHAHELINGPAADFDGTDDYVDIGKHDDLINFGLDDFEIKGEFVSNTLGISEVIYTYRDTAGAGINSRYLVQLTSAGKLLFNVRDTVAPNQNNIFSDNVLAGDRKKHTFRCFRASGTIKIEIDGVLQTDTATNDVNLAQTTNGNAFIGALQAGSQNFDGRIGGIEVIHAGIPISTWALGRGDTLPTAIDSVGSNPGTYKNMSAEDMATFLGGDMRNMSAGSIVADIPDAPTPSGGVVKRGNIFMGSGKYNEPFINTQRN